MLDSLPFVVAPWFYRLAYLGMFLTGASRRSFSTLRQQQHHQHRRFGQRHRHGARHGDGHQCLDEQKAQHHGRAPLGLGLPAWADGRRAATISWKFADKFADKVRRQSPPT